MQDVGLRHGEYKHMLTAMALLHVLLAILSLRGVRWAYISFIMLGVAYFPAKVGFRPDPRPCQLAFGFDLAVVSLRNYAHIVLFGLFFLISFVHFGVRRSAHPVASAAAMTLMMGGLVEIAQGLTGSGNCRVRDLIPDSAGILLGATTVIMVLAVSRRQAV